MLTPSELRKLRANYEECTGTTVPSDARPSDHQLSAMANHVKEQPNGHRAPPFAEFAIFGPFGVRSAKLRTFHAHVLSREGTWQQKLLTGPSSFAAWNASWRVYAATLVMLGLAKPGQLDNYRNGIGRLDKLFPQDWATIAAYEEELRSERLGRLYQEVVEGSVTLPTGMSMDKFIAQPWGVLLNECRFSYLQGPLADWWREREVALERGGRSRPGASKTGAAPLGDGSPDAPPLPSFSGNQHLRQEEPAAPSAGQLKSGQSYGGRGAGGRGRGGKGGASWRGRRSKVTGLRGP